MNRCLVLLFLVSFFMACNPYKKISNDSNRSESDRGYLSKACMEEFPVINGPIKVGTPTYSVNSANSSKEKDSLIQENDRRIKEYNKLLDEYGKDSVLNRILLYQQDILSKQFSDYAQARLKSDSLRIINNFLKEYKPKPIIINNVRVDTLLIADSAAIFFWKKKFESELTEHDKTKNKLSEMTDSRNFFRKWFWILIIVCAGFGFLYIRKILK